MQLARRKGWQIILFASLLFAALSFPSLLKRVTHSFHLERCKLQLPIEPELFSRLPREEIAEILSGTFTYLDRGAQSFVFLSENRRYVLKLFFFDAKRRLLSCWKKKAMDDAGLRKRVKRVLDGCLAACHFAIEESAIVYLHFGFVKEPLLPKYLKLKGPAWHRSLFELSSSSFALQLYAEPLGAALKRDYRAQNRTAFSKRIEALKRLLQSRISHFVHNSDPDILENFGFLSEDRAIEIDFGNYSVRREWTSAQREAEIASYRAQLIEWAEKALPGWQEEIRVRLRS